MRRILLELVDIFSSAFSQTMAIRPHPLLCSETFGKETPHIKYFYGKNTSLCWSLNMFRWFVCCIPLCSNKEIVRVLQRLHKTFLSFSYCILGTKDTSTHQFPQAVFAMWLAGLILCKYDSSSNLTSTTCVYTVCTLYSTHLESRSHKKPKMYRYTYYYSTVHKKEYRYNNQYF